MRYFLEISYKGTAYNGWQIQTKQKHVISVQSTLENRLAYILGHPVSLIASGRTDAGVHAEQQVAHFDTDLELDKGKIMNRLNHFLPADIAVQNLYLAHFNAHARFDVQKRQYIYRINSSKNPFLGETTWLITKPLDLDYLNHLAAKIKPICCFRQFTKSKTDNHNFKCLIEEAIWIQAGYLYQFSIIANRFLRSMVRLLVGQMIKVSLGELSQEIFERQLLEPDVETTLKFTAPAQGLTLVRVIYSKSK